jgi:uncharacterized repeat protein (TIGR03803 family)
VTETGCEIFTKSPRGLDKPPCECACEIRKIDFKLGYIGVAAQGRIAMQFRLCAPHHALLFSALALVLCVSVAPAQAKFKVLYSFVGGNDGAGPQASLIAIRNKATDTTYFYSTTSGGGANGKGTVFRLASHGAETVLHAFQAEAMAPILPPI